MVTELKFLDRNPALEPGEVSSLLSSLYGIWSPSRNYNFSSLSGSLPAPPNYPLRHPKYHAIETIRPLIEVHWGV